MDDPTTPSLRDAADLASSPPGKTQRGRPFQFSLSALLTVVVGVAVIGAGASFGAAGMTLGLMLAGVGWTALARRAGAYQVAYYALAGTEGGALAFFFAAPWTPGPLTIDGVLIVAAPCASVLLTARVLRRRILAPEKDMPWRPAVLAPYLVASFAWLIVSSVGVVLAANTLTLSEIIETFILGFLVLGVVITVSMPIVGPMSLFCCLWLRAIAMPYPGVSSRAEPSEAGDTSDNRPGEAVP